MRKWHRFQREREREVCTAAAIKFFTQPCFLQTQSCSWSFFFRSSVCNTEPLTFITVVVIVKVVWIFSRQLVISQLMPSQFTSAFHNRCCGTRLRPSSMGNLYLFWHEGSMREAETEGRIRKVRRKQGGIWSLSKGKESSSTLSA